MRVFVAGATGAVGRQLVPRLLEAGHCVVASTRSSAKAGTLRSVGAEPVVVDPLDGESVRRAVATAEPDAVIHQLTALTGAGSFKRFDQEFALTNRLRTEGLDLLVTAAREAGVKRFVAQSFVGWNNERTGGPVKDESDPLDPHPVAASRKTLEGIRHVEETMVSATDFAGLALRYGAFYGPGTGLAMDGDVVELVRRRRLPVVGGGGGVWSFTHISDVAAATVAALEAGRSGIYNVVDDDPAPVSEWLPYLAKAVGAKPPRHLPGWLARPMIGEMGISVMTQVRGASNAKAKRELGWTPCYPSWREGFRHGLGGS